MRWLHKKALKDINSINKVEETFGIKFPIDFQHIVKSHNAATPYPNEVDTSREKGKAFGELLNFNLDASDNIIILYQELKDKIPEKVFPITMDPAGNFMCFDFRDDEAHPVVVRWDHEQKFIIEKSELVILDHLRESDYYHLDFVADSFTTALANLKGEEIEASESWDKFQNTETLKKFSGEDLVQVNRIRALQGLPPINK
ncbi:SMI1/KNR4 family protein [Pedobacter agri]|uniref:SMI1/KNR4 family protein n=1 Tax=Pedobacter agri TaxID=454586 RepID=UPI00292E73A7|nr:SMI1/KNR4 family protein [Pedobacter agri]